MNRCCSGVLALALTACGANEPIATENPLRASLEQSIAGLDVQQPLNLRYNPAACACPAAELRLGGQWLRAELSGDDAVQAWLSALARTPQDNLPVPLQVQGRVEPEVLRTAQGNYAVRVDVTKVIAPVPPAAKPSP